MAASQAGAAGQGGDERPQLIEALQPLSYLVEAGEWRSDIRFFNEDGGVRARGLGRGEAEPILGGRAIERRDTLIEPFHREIVAWIFPADEPGRFRYVSYDSAGNFFDFEGEIAGGSFVFDSAPVTAADGETVIFRHIDTPLGSGAFRFEMFASRDGGESWTLYNSQINRRPGTEGEAEETDR